MPVRRWYLKAETEKKVHVYEEGGKRLKTTSGRKSASEELRAVISLSTTKRKGEKIEKKYGTEYGIVVSSGDCTFPTL